MAAKSEIQTMRKEVRRHLAGLLRPGSRGADGQALSAMLLEYPRRGGKLTRSTLCLLTCQALGGNWRNAVPLAAAIEAFHNFLLIHDDIEDSSRLRRGGETLHAAWGVPLALNAGDALCAMALRAALDAGRETGDARAARVASEFVAMLERTTRGQHAELFWIREGRWDVSLDQYVSMCMNKTAYYSFVAPVKLGALSARNDRASLGAVDRWGGALGAAFQVNDDMLNYAGCSRFGKELLEDVREGKRTAILLHLMQNCSAQERKWLAALMDGRARPKPAAVSKIARLANNHGSIENAKRLRDRLFARGLRGFRLASSQWPGREAVTQMENLFQYSVGVA